jgi:RimJ/RimL family protein N-acetyltransferase
LYARLGFVEEGREREALWHEGEWWDSVEFGMVEREWAVLREKWREEEAEVESRRMI